MSTKGDEASHPEREATANRRWMIGIILSVVFGLFGAVMALLNYMDRGKTPSSRPGSSRPATSPPAATPPAATPPAATPPADPAPAESGGDPAPDDKGKGHRTK